MMKMFGFYRFPKLSILIYAIDCQMEYLPCFQTIEYYILLQFNISISMIDKENQGYIRLGHPKTHHRNSRHSSITKDIHPKSNPQNLVIKIPDHTDHTQIQSFESKTQNQFYHHPTSIAQNSKQMSSTMSQFEGAQTLRVTSPSARIMSVIKGLPDDPTELQRKIKVLEARVRELHQQRQNERIKIDEQRRKINLERAILHKDLAEAELIKNKEIEHLRKQLATINQLRRPQISVANSQSRLSMKNSILIANSQTEENETQQIKELQAANQQLQAANQQLQRELKEAKLIASENQKNIEESKELIVIEYENKINRLQQKLHELQQDQEIAKQIKAAEQKQYTQKIRNLEMVNNKCMEERSVWKQELEDQNQRLRRELRVSSQGGGQNCQKCKQLIKSLLRLNSKMM